MKIKHLAILGTLLVAFLLGTSAHANLLNNPSEAAISGAAPASQLTDKGSVESFLIFDRVSLDWFGSSSSGTVLDSNWDFGFGHHVAWWRLPWHRNPGGGSGGGGTSTVPDNGTTVILIGLAFFGMALLSRRGQDFTLPS